jgi:hypothetical protein
MQLRSIGLETNHIERRISMIIEAWDTGAYRDVREIWQRAEILAGEDKFKGELVRGLNALTGHLEYDIEQIKSALSVLSALSAVVESAERGKHK